MHVCTICHGSACVGEGSGSRCVRGKGCLYSDSEKDLNIWKSIPESEITQGNIAFQAKWYFILPTCQRKMQVHIKLVGSCAVAGENSLGDLIDFMCL